MITIVPFEPEHIRQIANDNPDGRVFLNKISLEQLRLTRVYGMAYTGLTDGKPFGAGGMTKIDDNTGIVWCYFGETESRIHLCRLVKRILEDTADTLRLKRIEAKVLEHYAQGIKFLRVLGFINETPNGMKCAGPNGETMFLFSRVK